MKIKLLIGLLACLPLAALADICKTTDFIDLAPYATEIGANKVTFLAVNLLPRAL